MYGLIIISSTCDLRVNKVCDHDDSILFAKQFLGFCEHDLTPSFNCHIKRIFSKEWLLSFFFLCSTLFLFAGVWACFFLLKHS